MLLLGLFAFIQMSFLPGYLFLQLLTRPTSLITTMLLSFYLSLLINFFMVWLLVDMGRYRADVFYTLFLFEVLGFMVCLWKRSHLFVSMKTQLRWHSRFRNEKCWLSVVGTVFFAFILYIILHDKFVTLFSAWDAVVSWNRWAMDWASGILPKNTWHYPQLLPANWSVTYLFIQSTDVQVFAKLLMPFFPLFTLLAMLDLWLRDERIGYLLAIIVTLFLFIKVMAAGNFSGYADVPVASIAFAALYLLIISETLPVAEMKKYIVLGALLVSAAALTKQAGLFIASVYPLLVLFCTLKRQDISQREKKYLITLCVVMILSLVLPWYLIKQIDISRGIDESEIPYVTQGIYHGASLLVRFGNAFHAFVDKLGGNIIFILIAGGCLASLRSYRLAQVLFFMVVLPFFVVWAFFYSYDMRNVALILPVVGLLSGIGWADIGSRAARVSKCAFSDGLVMPQIFAVRSKCIGSLDKKEHLKNFYHGKRYIFVFFIGVLFSLNIIFPRDYIIQKQTQLRKHIGSEKVNTLLYAYLDKNAVQGKVLSNYFILGFLPEWDHYFEKEYYANFQGFRAAIEHKDIGYLLIDKGNIHPRIDAFVKNKITQHVYNVVFDEGNHLFLKVR